MAVYSVMLNGRRESVMTHIASLHKRNLFCFAILCIVLSIFTADIFDLREELQFLSSAANGLDDNITTGLTDHFRTDAAPAMMRSPVHQQSLVVISFSHLPSCGFRAPPVQS
jgi:hypothetical protein